MMTECSGSDYFNLVVGTTCFIELCLDRGTTHRGKEKKKV